MHERMKPGSRAHETHCLHSQKPLRKKLHRRRWKLGASVRTAAGAEVAPFFPAESAAAVGTALAEDVWRRAAQARKGFSRLFVRKISRCRIMISAEECVLYFVNLGERFQISRLTPAIGVNTA